MFHGFGEYLIRLVSGVVNDCGFGIDFVGDVNRGDVNWGLGNGISQGDALRAGHGLDSRCSTSVRPSVPSGGDCLHHIRRGTVVSLSLEVASGHPQGVDRAVEAGLISGRAWCLAA